MVLEILRVVFGLLLIFVVPGTLLVKAMFPRPGELDKEYNAIYVLTIGMAVSVCLTILVGFVLGSIEPPEGAKGYFDTPYIVGSLVGLSAVFLVIGWWRGAYPWLGLIHKKLARFPQPADAPVGTRRDDELLARIEALSKEADSLKREVKDSLRRERTHGKKMASHYRERREGAEARLEEVKRELERARERQAKLVYEAKQRQAARKRRLQRKRGGRREKRVDKEVPKPEAVEESSPDEEEEAREETGSDEEEGAAADEGKEEEEARPPDPEGS